MKRLVLFLGLFLTCSTNAQANKTNNLSWNGVWEYQRYTANLFGALEISDCKDNQCSFRINTVNGAHTCSLEGKLKINADKGEYKEKYETYDGQYEDIVVTFNLDNEKKVITVDANYPSRVNCGMHGYFTGEYENKNNPLRYNTGFDCWAKNITDTEKTICTSKNLAQASKEMAEQYKSMQTKEWYDKRANCRSNEECLWDFYISSIKSGYEKEHGKPVNFYEYVENLSDGTLLYPTDYSLLAYFFTRNMQGNDYEIWTAAFSQTAIDDNECDKCFYREYGAAGLYTFMESAFYIDKDEIWLAFLQIGHNPQEKYIVVYSLPGCEEKDIPPAFNGWLNRLRPHFPQGIKLKHFTEKKSNRHNF